MTEKQKAIKAIKAVRAREKHHYGKWKFCKEHNFTLEMELHAKMQDELRNISIILQDVFNTGYVRDEIEIVQE